MGIPHNHLINPPLPIDENADAPSRISREFGERTGERRTDEARARYPTGVEGPKRTILVGFESLSISKQAFQCSSLGQTPLVTPSGPYGQANPAGDEGHPTKWRHRAEPAP